MAALLLNQALVPNEHEYRQYLDSITKQKTSANRSHILSRIPRRSLPSYGPLAILSALLDSLPGPWPVLDLQRIHADLWKVLPEEAKAGRPTNPTVRDALAVVSRQCRSSYSSLIDLYHPSSPSTAILDPENGRTVAHKDLASIVRTFRLPLRHDGSRPKPVVAISLPNGPLLAMTVLATATFYTAAPVAHGSGVGKEQFKADILQSRSSFVLASVADVERLGLCDTWLADAGILVLLIEFGRNMELILRHLDGQPVQDADIPQQIIPNNAEDTGIMLFTSGTSGTKKLVPLSIHSMICGVAMVVESWGLSPQMRCLNQMPLNHVGGLIRNLFAPVFSGGSVICCSAFDANLFWDCVEDYAPTWYYASPSMHQVILEAGFARPDSVAKSQIKLICNAAGGLLPSLAIQLRETFSTSNLECTVLPSYGMTECMPISTPSLDYRLEKTGTSGISVGPEIAILDGRDQVLAAFGEVGRIAVRGAPVFGGYLKDNNVIDKSCFTPDGWFDTGDMGYLDQEGCLYITGRSKEVINRGGELISPFEVEEAIVAAALKLESPIYGRVSKALAFSVTHDVLQEVVGLAVVTPSGARRACLRSIHESVKSVLSHIKIPVVLVYMDGGLPVNNNKVVRIQLADRLGLPEVSDGTPAADTYFEAVSPPPNTPLSKSIECAPLQVSHESLEAACVSYLPVELEFHVKETDFYPELFVAPKVKLFERKIPAAEILATLSTHLHGYNVPSRIQSLDEPLPRTSDDEVDEVALEKQLDKKSDASKSNDMSPTEAAVARVFAQVLSLSLNDISGASDFFELGGDSMDAGRLLNALRKEYSLRLPINLLFTNPKVSQLAQVIDDKLPKDQSSGDEKVISQEPPFLPGLEKTCSSTNPVLLLVQLLPIGLFYPMKRALTWTIFIYMLTRTQYWPTNESLPGRLFDLVLSIAIGSICTKIIAPCIAIVFKWLVIGRFKEGLYPMWGSYHTRWWLVQKTLATGGLGIFGMSNFTKIMYFRLLGAKIGEGVVIQKGATLGEYDLISIGDNAVLEKCIVRPFAAERNTSMYLGRIRIGANASVGLASIVAPGTVVPDNACIGPNSSSWELSAAHESNRDLAASKVPGAYWALSFFVGLPLQLIVQFWGAVPWLGTLVALVTHEPKVAPDMLVEVLHWFSSPYRVGIHYFALVARVSLGPIFFYVAVLVLKKMIDVLCRGPIRSSSVNGRSAITTFRQSWLRSIMPAAQFHKVTELFGTHYAMTSVLARALGSKVGKRVYWPGTGPSIQDFDLLDIGDDVVFGSRSHMVTSDGTGSDYVRIGAGAMVADRVTLLPGVQLGEKTIMGSGALTKRDAHYAPKTTWVGSKDGEAVCLSADTSSISSNPDRMSRRYHGKRATLTKMPSFNSTATTLNKAFTFESAGTSQKSSKHSSFDIEEKSRDRSYDDLEKARKTPAVHERGVTSRPSTIDQSATQDPLPSQSSSSSFSTSFTSPFGRAFYEGKATYRVWTELEIFLYSTLITIITGVYWNVPSVSAVQVVSRLYHSHMTIVHVFLADRWWRPLSLYIFFTAVIVGIMALQSVCVLLFVVAAKWVLVGKRKVGNYDWDKSPYCQRWQLFLKLETLRRHCYGGHGILGMLTGTHWITLYFRALGASIGKDCALFAGGLPSLMFTEPDLLTLGDRVSVDDASLVGHINSRGKFDLNALSVGERSVLRSGSRLLSGARMESDACLLEHTLVMAGDVVDEGVTCQGWPAEEFCGERMPTLEVGRYWKAVAGDGK